MQADLLTPSEAADLKAAVLACAAASGTPHVEVLALDLIEAFRAIEKATSSSAGFDFAAADRDIGRVAAAVVASDAFKSLKAGPK